MTELPVVSIHIYPVKGEPGNELESVEVEADGLSGDRRKKSAVHLVTTEEAVSRPRANFVIDGSSGALASLTGRRVRLDKAELAIKGTAGDCPGLYADVVTPGTVRVGDGLLVIAAPTD